MESSLGRARSYTISESWLSRPTSCSHPSPACGRRALLPSNRALPSVSGTSSVHLWCCRSVHGHSQHPGRLGSGGSAVVVAVSPGRRAGLSLPLMWEVGRACSSPLCCGGSSGHTMASSGEELFGRGSAHQSHHRGLRGPLPAHREPSPGWPTLYGVSGGAAQRPLGFDSTHRKYL